MIHYFPLSDQKKLFSNICNTVCAEIRFCVRKLAFELTFVSVSMCVNVFWVDEHVVWWLLI